MTDLDATPVEEPTPRGERLTARFAFLRGDSVAPMWIGIGTIGVGFVLIVYTWGKVAGLTSVPLQLPYFVSGGLTAIAFVLIGITMINLAAKRRDAIERDRQIEQLVATMAELRSAIEARAEVPATTQLAANGMSERLRRLTNPFVAGVLLGVSLVAAGLVTIGAAWRGAAATLVVPFQLPWLVSGGLAALALVGLGLAVVAIQTDRKLEAERRHRIDAALVDAVEALSAARRQLGR